ncbi:SoxR reducing system RseC family protein [Pseudohalioglobus lutimaris]|uniref:Transcriptional regulator n=1 Tax=Pseudohalioglobus lutimaris TaxID=1737061 RepID=A0A2N5X0M0_9GAMM|nr:SoxR reducing system RseC family protein [Pseudohalioglobus lutimaris]PLW68010.1 transcriptional regulator [Pseudohalioglobus lutimaris]
MLLETGRVVAIEPDGIWVETIRKTTCGSCAAQKGCGHGLLNSISSGRRSLIRALPGELDPAECRVDDEVQISIPDEVILRGSFIVYIVPLVFMMLGTIIGSESAGNADLGGALGAAAGFIVGFSLVRVHAWRHRDDRSLQPTLVDILPREAQALRIG